MSNKFTSSATCPRCGTTERYVSCGRCVQCMAAGADRRAKARKALRANQRSGIPEGYVKFDSMAHFILKSLYLHGPMSLRMLLEDSDKQSNAVTTAITRLKRYDYVKIVGTDRAQGERSHSIYGLSHIPVKGFTFLPKITKAERTRLYRLRQKVRVTSVFEFGGFGTQNVKQYVKQKPEKTPRPGLNWRQSTSRTGSGAAEEGSRSPTGAHGSASDHQRAI